MLYEQIMALLVDFRINRERALNKKIFKAYKYDLMTPKITAAITIISVNIFEKEYSNFEQAKESATSLVDDIFHNADVHLCIDDIISLSYLFHYLPNHRHISKYLLLEAENFKNDRRYKSILINIHSSTILGEAKEEEPCKELAGYSFNILRKLCKGKEKDVALDKFRLYFKAMSCIHYDVVRKKTSAVPFDSKLLHKGFNMLRKSHENVIINISIIELIDFGYFADNEDGADFAKSVSDNAINCAIGMELTFLRKKKDLSIDDVAKLANMKPTTIDQIENGAESISGFAPAIARALNVRISEIYKSADVINEVLTKKGIPSNPSQAQ